MITRAAFWDGVWGLFWLVLGTRGGVHIATVARGLEIESTQLLMFSGQRTVVLGADLEVRLDASLRRIWIGSWDVLQGSAGVTPGSGVSWVDLSRQHHACCLSACLSTPYGDVL